MQHKPQPRAALYARYSSDMQNARSLDDQLALARGYAEREGLVVTKAYTDAAKTGATLFDRTGLFDLMNDAKAHQFDVVIVESLDRLSRDQEDLAGIFKRLQFAEVEIRTINEGTATPMHVGLRGLVGQMFLADLGAKVRRGHSGRVREGKIPGRIAYGYRAIPGRPGERAIDPEQAGVVLRIFTEYAQGKSPIAIAADLNAEGIPGHNGRPWQWPRLTGGPRALLVNRLYLGEIHWNNWRNVRDPETGRVTKRSTPAEERMIVRAEHLRIVPSDLFEQAQAVRVARGRAQNITPGNQRRAWQRNGSLLSGLLRCEACGGSMVRGQGDRGGKPRIMCSLAKIGSCDHRKSYDEAKVEAQLVAGLKTLFADERMLQAFAEEYTAGARKMRDSAQSELGEVKKRLTQIEAATMRLVNFLEKGTMAEDIIASRLQELEVERSALLERERIAREAVDDVDLRSTALQSYRRYIMTIEEDLANGDLPGTRENLRHLIDHVDVRPTPKRAPYEVAIYGRLSALLGINLNPPRRSPQEIVAEHGSDCRFSSDLAVSKYE